MQAEHDNLRTVLAWATGHDAVLGARIAAPLWRYWQMRGYLREGRALLEGLLEQLPATEVASRRAVLGALGGVAYWQRDLPAGEAACAEAVRLAEQIGDPRSLAEALYNLSFAVWQQGRMDEAAQLADRSMQLFTELGDTNGTGRVLWLRGVLAFVTQELDTAERLFLESVERHRGGTDAFHLGWSLRNLGRTLLLQGRAAEARPVLEESLRMFAPVGDVSAIVLHLSDFATLAGLEGDVDREVRLAGAVQRLQRLTGTDLVDHPINAVPRLAATVARLGADGERLLAEGAALSDTEAVRYALREEPSPAPAREP